MIASPQSRDARGEDRLELARAQARLDHLPVMEQALMMRVLTQLAESAVKDKTYQRTPIGQEVRRFLQTLQYDDKPTTTLDSYEDVLARLALDFADFTVGRFCQPNGVDYLRDFLSRRWGECSTATRRHHHSVLRSFFDYQVNERGLNYNPARKFRLPRAKGAIRSAHERSTIRQLLDGQNNLRDRAGLHLMCRLGLRKNDLRMLRVGEIDLARNIVRLLHRKGGDPLLLPIGEYPDLVEDLYLHIQAGGRQPEEFLIFPKQHRLRPMDKASIHRWFKGCLEKAGLPDFPMHELRHTAGTEIYQATGNIVAAQQLLGHRSLETTRLYVHTNEQDLRRWMRDVAAAWAKD
jgi:site-specific recombinase XerC